jgi:uncharacterized protein YxjI
MSHNYEILDQQGRVVVTGKSASETFNRFRAAEKIGLSQTVWEVHGTIVSIDELERRVGEE